jgi:hypothetical protein
MAQRPSPTIHAAPFAALSRFLGRFLGLVLGLALTAGLSLAAEPNGPRFGNATITSEIRTAFETEDQDVYVESLAQGETLRVRVAATKNSELLPLVEVAGPDGLVRVVEFKSKKGGRLVLSKSIPIDMTGRWAVYVRGAATTEGGYAAKFKIGAQKSQVFKAVAVGGDAGATVTQRFEAVEGAVAAISVKSGKKGARARFNLVIDPAGGSVGDSVTGVKTKGPKASIKKLTLADGDGAYGVVLSAPEGAATVTVKVALAPPRSRPRGKIAIASEEPYLGEVDEPLEGFAAKSFPLVGANLDTDPRPDVWFGERRASVVNATGGGTTLNVIPPDFAIGTTVPVEVIAPDGQAIRRETYFTYLEPEDDGGAPSSTLAVVGITPDVLNIDGNKTQAFEITINEDAPPGGVFINLVANNGIGQVPPTVRVPTNGRRASFLFRAVNANVAGTVQATYNASVVTANISVREVIDVPPPGDDTLDISGWIIQQQSSSRSIVIPQGTVLAKGDYFVLGRNATKAQFESNWGVTFGENVVYVNSVDEQSTEIPTINGGESYDLLDAFATRQDGPTIRIHASIRQNLQRTPGTDATQTSSWNVQTSPNSVANPGSGVSTTAANNGIFISEFSDRTGSGAYVYEFVELYYDGEPE